MQKVVKIDYVWQHTLLEWCNMISLDVGELINKDFVKAVAMTILCMVEIIGCYDVWELINSKPWLNYNVYHFILTMLS